MHLVVTLYMSESHIASSCWDAGALKHAICVVGSVVPCGWSTARVGASMHVDSHGLGSSSHLHVLALATLAECSRLGDSIIAGSHTLLRVRYAADMFCQRQRVALDSSVNMLYSCLYGCEGKAGVCTKPAICGVFGSTEVGLVVM